MNPPNNPRPKHTDHRSADLSSDETARYSRHLMLPEVGLDGQKRLKASRVLVIGAGGLGSPVALYLAAAGVGTIGLADFDRVEAHNLQRQILHRDQDIGRPKIESGARTLSGINPNVRIRLHPDGVTAANVIDLFSSYDLVVDGSDNFPTRYLNTDAAHLTGRPLVYGSLFRFEGRVSLFDTRAGGPCYRCLFPAPPEPGTVPNCAEAGILGALCGVIGSLQAMEAIKSIVGIEPSLRGTLLVVDALEMQFQRLRIRSDPDCPLCSDTPIITEITPDRYEPTCSEGSRESLPPEMDPIDVHHRLETNPEDIVIDVREPFELAICRIENAMHVPMRQIPGAIDTLPQDRQIYVLCHHGHRSLRVMQFLNDQGFAKVTNIRGGIDAWARTVDASLKRY
ncbi:MAG: molybdenum cofactor biosynthesis protein MoeB [Verrucomicrobia bacterium]|nr:MAG: molybdenum cofactor biosynthesis protein MoeB [Verrucomicrobiota bacterium]